MILRRLLPLVAVLAISCPSPQVPDQPPIAPPPSDPSLARALDEADSGVTDPSLAALLRDHWAWVLREDPVRATRLGVHAYDDRIHDASRDAVQGRREMTRKLLGRAQAIDAAKLDAGDRVTLALLVDELETSIESFVCDFHEWTLDPRSNPVTEWNELHEVHKVDTPESGAKLVSRYRKISTVIDADIANLRRGVKRGLFPPADSARRVLQMVKKQLALPVAEWPMLIPARAEHPEWAPEQVAELRAALADVVEGEVKPALTRYAELVETTILPKSRPEEQSGLSALPEIGAACYKARIRAHTTLPLTAQEIHDIGLREIARIDEELTTLGKKALGTGSLAETLAKLRTDPSLYFKSDKEIIAAAEEALAAAKASMGSFFGILPKADCVVRVIPDYEAPYSTIAYYRPPHADGSKPGEHFVNVLAPETRPRFEMRVLSVHESIPGHHLQIAIAQEQAALPAFRKHAGVTAYVEGWALYTERLGEEMGIYRDDLDRIGVASFDAWRAGRLVVDTGIHALGWSRAQAVAFLTEHTALSPSNIDNEVDRYIVWPGQALAYKLGQLEISRLRKEAEERQGAAFSLPAFHDAVLSIGAVSMPVLRQQIGEKLHQ